MGNMVSIFSYLFDRSVVEIKVPLHWFVYQERIKDKYLYLKVQVMLNNCKLHILTEIEMYRSI